MKAKKKRTRLWSILLVLVLVVGMLPTVALAAEPATEKADFSTDSDNALRLLNAAKTGTTDSTWDPDTNTLTLNGVNFTTTASTAVKLPAGAIIVLNGVNTINGGNSGEGSCYGIYGAGDLTIQGTGTLKVTGGTATKGSSYGIYSDDKIEISGSTTRVTANGGTATGASIGIEATNGLSISGTATVTAKGGAAGRYSYGINVLNTMSISGGTVNATGGTAADSSSYGIYTEASLTISGTADVTAKGGTATSGSSYGLSGGKVTISGTAKVEATGGEAADKSYGINSYIMNIEGGTVTAKGGEATGSSGKSYGIYASGYDGDDIGVKISGGTTRVTATGGTATNNSYGIYATYKVNIAGGTVNATGGTSTNDSYGIFTYYDAIIESGTVTAKGGEATNGYSKGISSIYETKIYDGTVTAEGGTAKYSYGIYTSDRPLTIYSGTVTAKGGAANDTSYGIIARDIIISGGTVTAEAKTSAFNKSPSISISSNYWWRTSESGTYTASSENGYAWDSAHIYVEIRDTAPAAATTYKVSFDANGGTGTMADVPGLLGDYTLPENRFTAPVGMQFKCWSVGGIEKAVGATINVTANTTVMAVWKTIVTAVWETIPATSTEYDILDGANSSWTQNSDGSLSIRGSGAFSEFVGVKVDGKSVDEQYYTVKEGSTIVTLKAEYLSTLAAGPHTIQLIWKDGTASTTFNINVNNPNTGDNGGLALAAALLALSAAAIATSSFNRKRGKSSR